MPFTSLATKIYRGPIDVVWANSIKSNDDYFLTASVAAWICFDGSAAALSAMQANNVSSITDSGVGKYMITFTTGFSNTGYAVFVGGIDSITNDNSVLITTHRFQTTSTVGVSTWDAGVAATDGDRVTIAVIGLKQ